MARRSKMTKPQSADLTPERMHQGIKRLEAALRQVTDFDPNIKSKDETSKADRLAAAVEGALTQTFGHETIEFNRYRDAAHFSWPINYAFEVQLREIRESLRRCRACPVEMLQEAIAFLQNELDLSMQKAGRLPNSTL
jgi:hypothetical protein